MTQVAPRLLPRKRREPGLDRIATSHLRQPPDFVIIGAQKGGTTSLYNYLTQHPDVAEAYTKEVHYFDLHYEEGKDWYLAHFPLRDEGLVVGEASPSYLLHPDVPHRLHAAIPETKLIALLRNPIDRAYSHYRMVVRRGAEPLPFDEAIDRESERLRGVGVRGGRNDWRRYSYLTRGIYVDQLRRWLTLFPREQLLVLKSEQFFEEPEHVYGEALAFLGLQPWRLGAYETYNPGGRDSEVPPETRARLVEHFAPYNRQLYDLLGRDLRWEHD